MGGSASPKRGEINERESVNVKTHTVGLQNSMVGGIVQRVPEGVDSLFCGGVKFHETAFIIIGGKNNKEEKYKRDYKVKTSRTQVGASTGGESRTPVNKPSGKKRASATERRGGRGFLS